MVFLEAVVARLRRMGEDMPPGGGRIEDDGDARGDEDGDAGADALPFQAPAA